MAKGTRTPVADAVKGVKNPAAMRCNRLHPRSPHRRQAYRRTEAAARQVAYDALTLEERIARAKAAPGKATRQLERLTSS